MHLADTVPGEVSPICIFESTAGDSFSVPRPAMSQEEEMEVIASLIEILNDEGMI